MKKIKRVTSSDGKKLVDVLQEKDGSYSLQRFTRKYDSEEDCEYEIRELPYPEGKFAGLSTAIDAAKRILKTYAWTVFGIPENASGDIAKGSPVTLLIDHVVMMEIICNRTTERAQKLPISKELEAKERKFNRDGFCTRKKNTRGEPRVFFIKA